MLLKGDLFLLGFLVLAAGCAAALIRKVKPFQILFWSVFYIYAIVVLGLTLFPIPYQGTADLTPVPHNFIPFHSVGAILAMGVTPTSLTQIGGNILLAVPYGIALTLIIKEKKTWRFALLPFLFPAVIELLQLFIGLIIGCAYRSFDIDDFILNALGAYLGILFSNIFLKKYQNRVYQKLFPKKAA